MCTQESPFYPGSPAPPEIFVGREDEIDSITRYINQNAAGRQQHVFLYGDRGIGKSSLATYIMNIAEKEKQMIGIHIILDGTHDVETLVKEIIDTLLSETKKEKWYNKVWDALNIESVTVNGGVVNATFNPNKEELENITRKFPETLKNIVDNIHEEKNGIFIILDDINGLTENADFANWYKSFNDTVAIKYQNDFPVFMMVVGLREKRIALYNHNESFMRIFKPSEIVPLEDEEVEVFFKNTFKLAEIKVEKPAMELMVRFSSGMPTMMHEIGDAVFWLVDVEKLIIDSDIASKGVIQAGHEIGRKYLQPHNIKSEAYKSILRKLGKNGFIEFTIEDLKSILDEDEKKKITAFLSRCKKLGIIVQKEGRGAYKFVNNLYPIYYAIETK